jgi:hypothetical protein
MVSPPVIDPTEPSDLDEALKENARLPWDSFEPEVYVKNNYITLHEEDAQLLALVRDYFTKACASSIPRVGVDVGAGANLYPALSMLPFCQKVELLEPIGKNRDWLEKQVTGYEPFWDPYWEHLAVGSAYAGINPRTALAERTVVRKGDVFALQKRKWDMGTMFFVAESITSFKSAFREAVRGFVGSLKVGAPLAAAFMWGSTGYTVGDVRFPAVSISSTNVKELLAPLVDDLRVESVSSQSPSEKVRPGYKGMILALGRVAESRT